MTVPGIPGQPVNPGGWAPAEIDRWAHSRRPDEREKVPWIGERVLFREHEHGPAVPALVHDVQDMTGTPHNHWHRHGNIEHLRGPGQPDVNVWEPHPAGQGWVLKADPWPWVHIREIRTGDDGTDLRDEDGNLILAAPRWCREARVRGSAGWLREGSRAHTGNYEE